MDVDLLERARSRYSSWIHLVRTYRLDPHVEEPSIRHAVRRAAVRESARWDWSGYEFFVISAGLATVLTFVAAVWVIFAIEQVNRMGSGAVFWMSVAAVFELWLSWMVIGQLTEMLQFLPRPRSVSIAVLCSCQFWLSKSSASESFRIFYRSIDPRLADLDRFVQPASWAVLVFLTIFFTSSLTLSPLWAWISEVLHDRRRRALSPRFDALIVCLQALEQLDECRRVWMRPRQRRVVVRSMRFVRLQLVRQVSRSVRSLGGNAEDRRWFRRAAVAVEERMKGYERSMLAAASYRDFRVLLNVVCADVILLAQGRWPDRQETDVRSPRLAALTKAWNRIGGAVALAGLAFALPFLPGISLQAQGFATIQTTLFVGAVASLITGERAITGSAIDLVRNAGSR
ncbi:hypothetical protein [Fodinicola feengrottensis]|uniref:hypothetical protein n=1 Tax=Fodinicola feengrottensis TaxID=435914 RepID=UPI0031CFFC94